MAIVSSGLVFHVDADSPTSYPGSGSTWYDLSGNSRNVTMSSAPTIGTSGLVGGSQYLGISGMTMTFPDTGLPAGNSSFSMGLWVYQATNSGGGGSIFYGTRDTDQFRFTGRGNSNYTSQWSPDGGGTVQYINLENGGITSNDKWYNVMVTWNSTQQRFSLYQNGCLQVTQAVSALNTVLTGTGGMGKSADNNYGLNGSLFEAYIYNRELTAAEVWQNYYSSQSRVSPTSLGSGSPAVAYPAFTPPTPVVPNHAGLPPVI